MATGTGVEGLGRDDVVRDDATISYFDDHVPEYSVERLQHAADLIKRYRSGPATLVDLGCGAGNTLEFVDREVDLDGLCGIDVSENLLAKTRERVDCQTVLASVLDEDLADRVSERYDFALVAAVLHHLIGKSRKQSALYATLAVRNALSLLKPGGHLIVLEPVFYPPWAMDGVFWVKKALTRLTSQRVTVGGYWNNIGPPVVSYYTNERLTEMVEAAGAEVLEAQIEEQSLGRPMDLVLRKTNTTLVARKP